MKKQLRKRIYEFEYENKDPFYLNEVYYEKDYIPFEIYEALDIIAEANEIFYKNIKSGKRTKEEVYKGVSEDELEWAVMITENLIENQELDEN